MFGPAFLPHPSLYMLKRAWSKISVKSVSEDDRTITGIASTPKTDRMDDIVDPEGAVFELPLPFLMQHDSDKPVGHVIMAKPTKDGIPVTIKLQKTDEPGGVKDRLDDAWMDIKLGLVRGLSIGFNPLEWSDLKGTFGVLYSKWEWLELSGVTIPANIDATIQTIKSYDRAATGTEDVDRRTATPRARGSVKLIKTLPKAGDKMTIKETITQFENTRAAKTAERDELMKAASDKGETLDVAEAEKYDGLRAEIKSIDEHLVRLREQEAENVSKAVPVTATSTETAAQTRTGVTVKHEEKLEPGIEFARYVMCEAAAKGNTQQALALAQMHYPQQVRGIAVLKAAIERGGVPHRMLKNIIQTKAAVAGASTTDATWAAPLVAYNTFAGDFVEFLRAKTILGQFGLNGVPSLRQIPFNVHIKAQTSGGTGYWVGAGKAKPVTKFDFIDAYHAFAKVAAIAVLEDELIRFSDPSAEQLVRDALAGCLIERMDTDFIDPDVYYIAGVRPASITRAVTPIVSSGDTEDDVLVDIAALWGAGMAANLELTSAVYITTPAIGMSLGLMRNALGQPTFPGMSMRGGSLLGVPVITSNYVGAGDLILAFANEIYLSDDGTVTVDASNQASIEMSDAPAADAGAGTGASVVSMFQTDSTALRAERFVNWSKRRSTAVAYLSHVSWGGLTIES